MATRAQIEKRAFDAIRKGLQYLKFTAPPLLKLHLIVRRDSEDIVIWYDPKTTEYIIDVVPQFPYDGLLSTTKINKLRLTEKNVIPTIIKQMDVNDKILRCAHYPEIRDVSIFGFPNYTIYRGQLELRNRQKLRNYVKKRPAHLMLLSRKGMPQNIMREIMKRVNKDS